MRLRGWYSPTAAKARLEGGEAKTGFEAIAAPQLVGRKVCEPVTQITLANIKQAIG